MNAPASWRRLPIGARVTLGIVGAIVIANVAFALLDSATRGRDETGATSSSLSTAPTGTAAYAELLQRAGHPTRSQRGDLRGAVLDPRSTLIVFDPSDVAHDEIVALRTFVQRGGNLVAGGDDPDAWLGRVVPALPPWSAESTRRATTVFEDARYELRTDGSGTFRRRDGEDSLLITRRVGSGTIAALADTSPLQNRLLGRADNAALGLGLAGSPDRPVAFAEGVHGFGDASGIDAVPGRWKVALLGLAAAALVTMVSIGRRIGPAEAATRTLPPPRRAYVDALASLLARTRPARDALAPTQLAVRQRLATRAGLPPDADLGRLESAARRAGWPADEIRALDGPLDDDALTLALGRAVARVEKEKA
jgi:hypothetical protein